MRSLRFLLLFLLVNPLPALATVFASVQGIVHDPQHPGPLPMLRSRCTLLILDFSLSKPQPMQRAPLICPVSPSAPTSCR